MANSWIEAHRIFIEVFESNLYFLICVFGMVMLKCFFLKKKRFLSKDYDNFFSLLKTGFFLSFEYLSLDLDSIHKYKFYGLCTGMKSNYTMTACHLNTVVSSNRMSMIFFALSPFIFNFRIVGSLKLYKSKVYNLVPKLRAFRQFL
jgi:hypothetical protein